MWLLFLLCLPGALAFAYTPASRGDQHLLEPHKPRFAEYVYKTTKAPAYAGVARSALPAQLPPEATAIVQYYRSEIKMMNYDYLGRCNGKDGDAPVLPANGVFTPSTQDLIPNNAVVTLSCTSGSVLQGNNQVTCQNSRWKGGPIGICVCPRPSSDWCPYPDTQDIYTYTDCDGDNLLDHVCEHYDLSGVITRSIISANSTQCIPNNLATVKDCPVAFKTFPYPAIGQCFGLNFNPATNLRACKNACAADPSCYTWQWSNVARQCWIGRPQYCGGGEPHWIGASRGCNRPAGWCMNPYLGDVYVNDQDCDGDGILDHACINGNNGGRIASQSDCKNNWPNATNEDCHAAFD